MCAHACVDCTGPRHKSQIVEDKKVSANREGNIKAAPITVCTFPLVLDAAWLQWMPCNASIRWWCCGQMNKTGLQNNQSFSCHGDWLPTVTLQMLNNTNLTWDYKTLKPFVVSCVASHRAVRVCCVFEAFSFIYLFYSIPYPWANCLETCSSTLEDIV